MKKFGLCLILAIMWTFGVKAIVLFDQNFGKNKKEIEVSGYYNFAPVGYFDNKEYKTVYKPLLEEVYKSANLEAEYIISDDLQKNIATAEQGDVFIGCFSQSEKFAGLDLIYPSVFTSPISIITLPQTKIAKISEIKNLKGAFDKNEEFSDFVSGQIKNHGAKEYDGYYAMFEALFNKEIDYIFSNYYYGLIEIAKIGVENEVSISKQGLWNVPTFICINPQGKNSVLLKQYFEKHLRDEKTKQKIKENLIKTINDIKIENKGVFAPDFIKENGK